MARFAQQPIIEEGLDDMLTDQEKHKHIRKALEIHMLENREAHMKKEAISSFTQGNQPNVIESSHQFDTEEEKKQQKSIEQQQLEQQQQWASSRGNQQGIPVRTCPCCVNFLRGAFGLSDKDTAKYTDGVENGPVNYQDGSGYSESSSNRTYSESTDDYRGSSINYTDAKSKY